ncbi:acyltransferase family protein [Flexibacterium corallicola]|uniref:acyltransferase family protein n=1 Tax=Flexibacterium corallicola TaxID=3037259 RepID=UPI00286EF9B1|nr:acyltransferase family protein [Pseudovibrio sp. M1P-2-3]
MLNTGHQGFRPDIEGLRGLAVLLVILFHFKLLGLQAGFIGVDIFFVISGFLMTQILTSPKFEWTKTGILSFYRKRFWRLAPAYYVVLLGVLGLIFAYPWQFDFDKLSTGLLSSAFFAYNIVAPSDTGYFGTEAVNNPVLHLWSLGVEIQFYLIWPIVLLCLKGRSYKAQIAAITAITAVSFILSQVLVIKDPEVAYYLVFTRLWQFGFGALAALVLRSQHLQFSPRTVAFVQSFSIAVILGVAWFMPKTEWPSIFALLPTIACTALIIGGTNHATTTNSILCIAPLRWLGKISYSLYLIHWPMVVLGNAALENYTESQLIRSCFVLASLFIALALYAFIEDRIRKIGAERTKLRYYTTPVCAVLLISSGYVVLSSNKIQSIFFREQFIKLIELEAAYKKDLYSICHKTNRQPCIFGNTNSDKTIVLWGDSHARHLTFGLHQKLKEINLRAALFTNGGCPPLIGITRTGNISSQMKCSESNAKALSYIQSHSEVQSIILAARWSLYNEENNKLLFENSQIQGQPNLISELDKTLNQLNPTDTKVVFIMQAPEFPTESTFTSCRAEYAGQTQQDNYAKCTIQLSTITRQFTLDKQISAVIKKHENTSAINLKEAFCSKQSCSAIYKDTILYYDDDHLNPAGSKYAVEKLFVGF